MQAFKNSIVVTAKGPLGLRVNSHPV